MSFRLVSKSVTLNDPERRNGRILRYFLPNLVISGAYCVQVVDKAITMDNIRLLSSSKRLQRDRATPTVKIPSRFINSRLNAQYLPSYRFDKKSYMSFRLVQISVTLNDLERRNGLILHYFTQFVYDVVVEQLLFLPRFKNLLLIVYDHINTICAIIQRLFRQNKV